MFKVLLVDDEPLVLIGLQGMLDWNELGWEVTGTARNGKEALKSIQELRPDLVLCDIKMPVMGGLALVKKCQELDLGLPIFIMLTSYEEFDYVKQSINLGVLEYLVKLDLTPPSLENALRRAENRIQRERALRAPGSASLSPANGLSQYRERFFLRLYGGMFDKQEEFRRLCEDFGLRFDAPNYIVAIGLLKNHTLETQKLATLSAGITNMAADTLPKYMPCTVTGMDLRHFSVLFPLSNLDGLEEQLTVVLEKAGEVLQNYFGTPIWWAVGKPVSDILEVCESHRTAFSILSLLSERNTIAFCKPQSQDYHIQQVVQVQEYIRQNLSERLSLNDVAAVFNFNSNYLSQLFAQWGESGFVEFVTATRVNAAKDLMAGTDLKIYEISEKVGFESPFYFSKVFKKVEGVTPRAYMQRMRGTSAP